MFTTYLIQLLPVNKSEKINIEDKISLEYAKLKETFTGSIELEKRPTDLKPSKDIEPRKKPKTKDTLQSIIEKVNELYHGDFSDSDKVIIEGIMNMFMKDKEVKNINNMQKIIILKCLFKVYSRINSNKL